MILPRKGKDLDLEFQPHGVLDGAMDTLSFSTSESQAHKSQQLKTSEQLFFTEGWFI